MSTKILICSTLIQRLERYKGSRLALYGIKSKKSVTIVTFIEQNQDGEYENILPAGLEHVGIFTLSLDEVNDGNAIALIKTDAKLECYHLVNESFKQVSFKAVENLDLATLRIRTKIPFFFSSRPEETDTFLDKLLDKINSDSSAFLLDKSRVVLTCSGDKSDIQGAPQDVTTEELAKYSQDNDDEEVVQKSNRALDKQLPIYFKMYWASVAEDPATGVPQCSPLIYYQRRSQPVLCLSLTFDTLSVIPWSDPAENIGPILCMSLTRQLKLFVEDLKEQLCHMPIKDIQIPKIFHFFPDSLQHYITVAYHPNKSEESLENYRKEIHQWCDLPLDRPVFRRGNRHWFPEDLSNQRQLINTHIGLNLKGDEVSLVQGRYAYHHYMQDRFDDNGWGCAYRSLQSIISWFKLQGYTDRSIPTHQEIQQCLVKIGDKPSSFINSRLWIGSMEVSFCLQTLIGVESTILNVSSGAEMSSIARQLGEHFRIHGTPIMIGGGVLAHTIIGVDFNTKTGDARFLILDPHYTGAEDLRTIQNKGWCNWKPSTFWKVDSFYNMCLPMRSVTF